MGHDLRFAFRMLRRTPGFTILAVIVLALGIGANTAIFSLVDALMLAPLPYAHPEQLVQLSETEAAPGSFPLSGPDFPDWKAQSRLFADMTLYNYQRSMNLNGEGDPQRVIALPAEANFFSLFGIAPELGRTFAAGEDQGAHTVAVLSHHLWESRFGGDPSAVGKTIRLDGTAYTIVGVAPASFQLQPTVDVWVPLDMNKLGTRGNHSFAATGRMRPGVTLAQAQAEISAIAARLSKQYPNSNNDTGAKLALLRDRLVRAPQRASLWTLLTVVGLVLLIACANIANLLLARALGRQKEMSIRLALGARRSAIVRQLLTESVLLAAAGAAAGAGLAWLGLLAVVGLKAFTLPTFNPITLNVPVLSFTAGLAVLCGVLFGLAPAWQLSQPRINDELSGAGSLAGGGRRRWLSDSLVVGEVALSLLLAVGAGLLLQSFARLRAAALGVNPRGLTTASITLPDGRYHDSAAIGRFDQALLERLRALPGVNGATLSDQLPLEQGNNGYITPPGAAHEARILVSWTRVTPSYFSTLQIPIVMGRSYSEADQQVRDKSKDGDALPIVVNQSFARHFLKGRNPLGVGFKASSSDTSTLVIEGVSADVAQESLGPDQPPQAYLLATNQSNIVRLMVRSSLPQAALMQEIRGALAGLDSTLPIYNVRSMDQVVDDSVAGAALQQWLVTGFALLALLLAAAGIYGVMAYLVAARTREIGVRMALGATRSAVLKLVVGRGLRLAVAGITVGVLAALAAGPLLASQLYQIQPRDPATLAAAAAVLLGATLLACYVPARRAASVDPNHALRVN